MTKKPPSLFAIIIGVLALPFVSRLMPRPVNKNPSNDAQGGESLPLPIERKPIIQTMAKSTKNPATTTKRMRTRMELILRTFVELLVPTDMTPSEKLYFIVGGLSVLSLGFGFVLGGAVYLLSMRVSFEQKSELKRMDANNIEARRQLENARREQAEAERRLREAFAPREIKDQWTMIGTLKSFRGTRFILLSLPDAEITHTAEQIYAVLGDAEWQLVRASKMSDDGRFMDGVFVQADGRSEQSTLDAARALVGQLNANDVEAHFVPSNELDEIKYGLTLNTVLVKVGFKPFKQPADENAPEGIRMRGNRRKLPEVQEQPPAKP